MTQFAIQHASEIIDGPSYLVHASHLIDNFNAVISDFSDRLSLITSNPQSVSGAVTFSVGTTFTGGLTANGAVTLASSVTISGNANLGKAADPGSPAEGEIWYNTTTHLLKYKDNNTTQVVVTGYPTRFQASAPLVYASSSTVSIASIYCRDSADIGNLTNTGPVTLNLANLGQNGLDTGTKANSTWYYVYAVTIGTNAASLMASTVNEAVSGTLSTANYAYTLKRQLPIAIRVDGSGNLIPFQVGGGWPHRPYVHLLVSGDKTTTATTGSWTAGTTNVLNGGSATTYTAVSLSSFVPAISRFVRLHYTDISGNNFGLTSFRSTGDASNGFQYPISAGASMDFDLPCNSSQSIDYQKDALSGLTSLDVMGFYVTEVV